MTDYNLTAWKGSIMNFAGKTEPVLLTADGDQIEDIYINVANAFARQCLRDTIGINNELMNWLAAEVERMLEAEPDLTDVERHILAKKLIRQRLNIVIGQLEQIS